MLVGLLQLTDKSVSGEYAQSSAC